MAADPADLTTLAAVKLHLGITGAADDVLLQSWITGASGWIEAFLNRTIKQATVTEGRSGLGGDSIVARQPLASVTSVTIDGKAIAAATPGDDDDGWFTDGACVRLRGHSFTRGSYNVVLVYKTGWTVVPPEIERACVELVSWRYKEKDRIAQTSKGVGGETVGFDISAVSPWAREVLQQNRWVVPG